MGRKNRFQKRQKNERRIAKLQARIRNLEKKPWTPEIVIQVHGLKSELAHRLEKASRRYVQLSQKQAKTAKKKIESGIPLTPYQRRDQLLRENGFKTYGEYLASDLWQQIRGIVFGKFKKCVLCGGPRRCVHHTGYSLDTLLGKALDQLVVLCERCHRRVEFDGKTKRTFDQATAEYEQIRREQTAVC